MNIINRINLSEYIAQKDDNGELVNVSLFSPIRLYLSSGYSKMFTCVPKFDIRNGIKANDLLYFKVNNTTGFNMFGRVNESNGSCEDVAEVLASYLIENLNKKTGGPAILKPTLYDFAIYENYGELTDYQSNTASLFTTKKIYGCVSKNILTDHANILHGRTILQNVENDEKKAFYSNNIYSYDQAIKKIKEEFLKSNTKIYIDPSCNRYLANLIFFDYFYTNSDRHSGNICFENVKLGENKLLLQPLPVLDNGGGMAMQANNCYDFYLRISDELKINDGKFENLPFTSNLSLIVGEKCFKNEDIKNSYKYLTDAEMIVALISQNKILFNDFKNMFNNLDVSASLKKMCLKNGLQLKGFNSENSFLPDIENIITATMNFKKKEISKVMANILKVDFDEEKYEKNDNIYIDIFERFVEEDELMVHIASNNEIEKFRDNISKFNIEKER